MRKLFAIGALCVCAYGQNTDPAVSTSGGPPNRAWNNIFHYVSGTDLVEYICFSVVNQPNLTNRSSSNGPDYTVTQIVDASNTATVTTSAAHGLSPGNQVVIAGVTIDTDLNGTYSIATVPSTTTFTYTSANVTDATYNNAGITIASSAPRTNAPIWAIKRFYYGAGTTGTSISAIRWAVQAGARLGGSATVHSCDGRASLAYQ